MILTIDYAGLTDIGQVREINEDAWFAEAENQLFGVADGIGGAQQGELASKIVAETLPRLVAGHSGDPACSAELSDEQRLSGAIALLSRQLRRASQDQPGFDGMGTTVVALWLREQSALLGHMGDSRAYRLRDGQLHQLTKDHTVVQLLLDSGDITLDDAPSHPARSYLTRFVGMAGEPLPEVHTIDICVGDVLLLCSDGLTNILSDPELHATLSREMDAHDICAALVHAANEAGGGDNITTVVVKVSQA